MTAILSKDSTGEEGQHETYGRSKGARDPKRRRRPAFPVEFSYRVSPMPCAEEDDHVQARPPDDHRAAGRTGSQSLGGLRTTSAPRCDGSEAVARLSVSPLLTSSLWPRPPPCAAVLGRPLGPPGRDHGQPVSMLQGVTRSSFTGILTPI